MENDMTKGAEWRVILAFALPIMGQNLLVTAYNLADTLVIAKWIGGSGVGAIGMLTAPIWLLMTFSQGIGAGVAVVAAQFYGAKLKDDVRATADAAYAISALMGIVTTAVCLAVSEPLISGYLRAPEEMRGMALAYFRICAFGQFFLFTYGAAYGLLRAHGDSRGGLLFLVISSIMNVGLNILFVAGLGWGAEGTAVATVASQAALAAACFVYLIRLFPHLRPRMAFAASTIEKMRAIVRISAPIIAQNAVRASGFIVLQRLVVSFGSPSVEGMAAMGRIESLAHIPSMSFNSAISAYTGQNIGAGLHDRARAGYLAAVKLGAAITIPAVIFNIAFGRWLLSFFSISGESMLRGYEHLVMMMTMITVQMVSMITAGFLQGAGDTRAPMLASMADLGVRLAASHIMAATFIGFRCIYLSLPFSVTTAFLMNVYRYRSGKWRDRALVKNRS